jgi:hypothetical protein
VEGADHRVSRGRLIAAELFAQDREIPHAIRTSKQRNRLRSRRLERRGQTDELGRLFAHRRLARRGLSVRLTAKIVLLTKPLPR